MKRPLVFLMALALAVVFAGATLAIADCSYHKSQAALEKARSSQDVAATPVTDQATDKADTTGQLKTAQVAKPTSPTTPADK